MSVYLTKFPLEARAILKYSETVNVLQKKGGNFLAFDENVRYLRQCKLSAWDTFHTEQYVEAMTQYRGDRMHRRGGGCLLYIKETIKTKEVVIEGQYRTETVWAAIMNGNKEEAVLGVPTTWNKRRR